MSAQAQTNPTKFEFADAFDALVDEEYAAEREKEKLWTDEQVDAERAIVRQAAFDEGRAAALNSTEEQIASALAALVAQAETMFGSLDTIEHHLEEQARELALAVGKTLASELLVHMREHEIEALVGECLGHLAQQPHVVIRVNEDLIDGFRARFEAIADQRGFSGRLIVMGEPDLTAAECQIEWADGGIRRIDAELTRKLDAIVKSHLSAAPAGTPAAEPAGAAADPDIDLSLTEEGTT